MREFDCSTSVLMRKDNIIGRTLNKGEFDTTRAYAIAGMSSVINATNASNITAATINYGHLVFACAITISAIIGNGAIISAFIFDRKLRVKISDWTLFALSVTDFALAAIILPIEIDSVVKASLWSLGKVGCHLLVWLSYLLVTASVYFILILSWDRYRLVSLDYSIYLRGQSSIKQIVTYLITIVIASIPGITENIAWGFLTPYRKEEPFHCIIPSAFYPYLSVALVASYSIIPTILVSIFAILFFIHFRRRMIRFSRVGIEHTEDSVPGQSHSMNSFDEGNNSCENSSRPPDQHTGNMTVPDDTTDGTANAPPRSQMVAVNRQKIFSNRYVKPAITYSVLVLSLITCTTPLGSYSALTAFVCPECFDAETLLYLIFLAYSKASLNPWITIVTHPKIRQFLKKAWKSRH